MAGLSSAVTSGHRSVHPYAAVVVLHPAQERRGRPRGVRRLFVDAVRLKQRAKGGAREGVTFSRSVTKYEVKVWELITFPKRLTKLESNAPWHHQRNGFPVVELADGVTRLQ